jgi:plasmid stability protein
MMANHPERMHIASMPRSITIRNVPDETVDELSARAARAGQSLQEWLRAHLVEVTAKPDQDELWARIRERKAGAGTRMSPEEIVALIHEGRR